jgi:hypothetical protein
MFSFAEITTYEIKWLEDIKLNRTLGLITIHKNHRLLSVW